MQEPEISLKNHSYDINVCPSCFILYHVTHNPLLNVDLGCPILTLRRVTVSTSFNWLASKADWNVDGTRIYRETGREGVERPMTSSAASGGNGNVAALQPYKVCALLCVNKTSFLNIYLASCPAPPNSWEVGRTDSGRGDHHPIIPIRKHSLCIH